APVRAQQETCIGDCDRDGAVHVDELVQSVNIALGQEPVGGCAQLDFDGNGQVTIDELMQAVRSAIIECRTLTRLTGTCEKPGASGLVGCPASAPLDLFRCDDRALCLKGTGRTLVSSTSIADDGTFSVTVDSAPVHSVALLMQARADPPAPTIYGVFSFS